MKCTPKKVYNFFIYTIKLQKGTKKRKMCPTKRKEIVRLSAESLSSIECSMA